MFKFFKQRRERELEKKILADRILRFNNKTEKLRDINQRLGCRLLRQVNHAYFKLGYQKEMDIKICRVFNKYLDYIFGKKYVRYAHD